MAEKIIIDTDIGEDIDDAEALVLAMRSPEVDLLGVTTVSRDVVGRARIARKLLDAGGAENIPVYCGCSDAMIGPIDLEPTPRQYDPSLDTIQIDQSVHAVDYLITTVMNSPGEITVVAIGALTNVAIAMAKEPAFVEAVKEIIWMGGAYYYHFRAWNTMLDPEAVRAVFESGAKLRVVGRDVGLKCVLSPEQVEMLRRPSDPALAYLAELTDRWHKTIKRQPALFDPLTVACVFDDRFVKFTPERIGVETRGEFTRGMTFVYNSEYPRLGLPADRDVFARDPIPVASDVDAKGFVRWFLERVTK